MSNDADPGDRSAAHKAAMVKLKEERDALMAGMRDSKRGLLLVNTGDGKGKSTAAFGLIARALGWGQKVGVVQFIKGKWVTGERQFFAKFKDDVRYHVMGEGFTWDTQDRERDVAAALAAWEKAKELMADETLSLVILDELNIALRYDYLELDVVLKDLASRRRDLNVCVTGRTAPAGLIEAADLVTEMTLVKHPFQQGIKARRGVDF